MEPISIGLGIGSLMLGLFGQSQADAQAEKQNDLLKKQQQMSEQEYYQNLQLRKEWGEKYGAIEHNMIAYVQSLDANTIYGLNEGGLRTSYETARKNIDSHLASRGFDVAGGVHAGMFTQLADMEAQAEVQLKQASEDKVQQARASLLQGNREPNNPSTANMQNGISNQLNVSNQQFAQQQQVTQDIAGSLGNIYKSATGTTEKDNYNSAVAKYKKSLGYNPDNYVVGETASIVQK